MSLARSRLHADPRRGVTSISDRKQPISKASTAQQEKVAEQRCVVCGGFNGITPMHLCARAQGGCDDPDCVVAGCWWCHNDFDRRQFRGPLEGGLLKHLIAHGKTIEILHMVGHYNGDLVAALERLEGQRVVVLDHERAQELGL